jgi:SAM-dependent methyltransferase
MMKNFLKLFQRPQKQSLPEEKNATWDNFLSQSERKLYAGRITRPEYFAGYFSLNPFLSASCNIPHDVSKEMPIPDESVDIYQSEDVFEHIPFEGVVPVLNDIHRVLRKGALFRLSLPDYRFDVYSERSMKDSQGKIYFDPGGGGKLVDGKVVEGGHLWFPTYELVQDMLADSAFASSDINFLHYNDSSGSHTKTIDYKLGHITRTPDHDSRAQNPYRAMSLVVDIWKK